MSSQPEVDEPDVTEMPAVNGIGSIPTPMADLTLYRLSRVARDCTAAAAGRGDRV